MLEKMLEALQEKNVIEKLQEKGYEPNIYVIGIVEASVSVVGAALFGVFALLGNQPKRFILNFSEKGIAFLELHPTSNKYTGLHTFIAVEQIERLSFNKGMLINTLTILTTDGNKQKIKISNAGLSWHKDNVKRMIDFLPAYKKW